MIAYLTPHCRLERIVDLTAQRFQGLDRPGLLLDVDSTLKDHGAVEFSHEVIAWADQLRNAGARLCLLSNGRTERIGRLAQALDVPFVAKAYKPLPFGCRAALRQLRLRPDQACVAGDQVFADVLAGRLAGLFTILVRPTSPREPWFTRIKRPLERQVLKRLDVPFGLGDRP